MQRMMIKMFSEVLNAVKAMRTLCDYRDENLDAEELRGSINDVTSDLLFEMARMLVIYERTDAMSFLHKLHRGDLNYDDFVDAVLDYRRPIVGDEQPADWELPFYGMLMLTEPTNEEASDE